MGLTLIRKSNGEVRGRKPKIALVLAGGAFTGGAFKIGGLKALDDFLVGRKLVDLDLYVGLSAGALLSAPLAAGLTPDEMMEVLDGSSVRCDPLRPGDVYSPNVREFLGRPLQNTARFAAWFPRLAVDFAKGAPRLPKTFHSALGELLRSPDTRHLERLFVRLGRDVAPSRPLPKLSDGVPTALFSNAPLEAWLRRNLAQIGAPNDFAALARQRGSRLYVAACNLDTAERTLFGVGEHEGATISEAVQASTALPILYQPVRLNGVDYVDGAVRNTANIAVAIDKGADLVICYNPFRPIWNARRPDGGEDGADEGTLPVRRDDHPRITDQGLKGVLNQSFRTLLQSRLVLGLDGYRNHATFQGDIVVLEPKQYDMEFFGLNPLAYWERDAAMRHGFESVRHTIEQNFDVLEDVFARYGLKMSQAVASRRAAEVVRDRQWSVAANEPPSERRFGRKRRALRD